MADYDYGNAANRLRARNLLARLLPRAREFAAEHGGDLRAESHSVAGRGVMEHIKVENMVEVHVYRGPVGGWHADIVLENLPVGVPNVIGTPSAMPCATRAEAEEAAVAMIGGFVSEVAVEHTGPKVPEGMVAFGYDEVIVHLPRELIETIHGTLGTPPPGYAARRLDELRGELPGKGPMTRERIATFSLEQVARLQSIVALAIISRIPRWPEPEHMPPPSGPAN
jgi:hypothetical protein